MLETAVLLNVAPSISSLRRVKENQFEISFTKVYQKFSPTFRGELLEKLQVLHANNIALNNVTPENVSESYFLDFSRATKLCEESAETDALMFALMFE